MFPEFYAYFTAAGSEEAVYQKILQDLQSKRSDYRVKNVVNQPNQLSFDLRPNTFLVQNAYLPHTVLTFDGVRFLVRFSLDLTVHILMLVFSVFFYIAGIFICVSSQESGIPHALSFLLPTIVILVAYLVMFLSAKDIFRRILLAVNATSRTKLQLKKIKKASS